VVVVVTSMVSVAERIPSLTVNVQWPAATGVTLKLVPLGGETVAIPLHEPAVPAAAVVTVNEPEKPASDTVNGCAPLAARKDKLAGVSITAGGDCIATADPVPPGPLHPRNAPTTSMITIARRYRARWALTMTSSVPWWDRRYAAR
jgi:hypothetical protein